MKEYKQYQDFNYKVASDGTCISGFTNKELKPIKCSNGYLEFQFNKNGKRYCKLVHRVVAELFIPNPLNKNEVNHLDENITNNDVSNLEWVTSKENANYGTRNKRAGEKHRKPVMQFKDGVLIKTYKSVTEASKELGIGIENITRAIEHKQNRTMAKGYTWKYC